MTRLLNFLGFATVIAAIILGLLQLDLSPSVRAAVILAPFGGIVLFGVYLLATLAYGVANFKNCPQEAENLQKDIAWARSELSRRGVTGPGPLPEYSE